MRVDLEILYFDVIRFGFFIICCGSISQNTNNCGCVVSLLLQSELIYLPWSEIILAFHVSVKTSCILRFNKKRAHLFLFSLWSSGNEAKLVSNRRIEFPLLVSLCVRRTPRHIERESLINVWYKTVDLQGQKMTWPSISLRSRRMIWLMNLSIKWKLKQLKSVCFQHTPKNAV